MAREDILDINGGVFFVGPGALVQLPVQGKQSGLVISVIAAGTSGVYMGGASMGLGLAAAVTGFSNSIGGYLMSTGQVYSGNVSGSVYFTSAGTTATISYSRGLATRDANMVYP